MRAYLIKEINKLKHKSSVNKRTFDKFVQRIKSTKPLTKEHSQYDHICTFFVPINKAAGKIFIGHHIKADDWIPPGGHIKLDEHPVQTVKREFVEELNHSLTDEKIELFDLTIKYIINNPRHNCKVHYDLWYLVYTDKHDFNYTRKEFYQARWMKVSQAKQLIQNTDYRLVISKLLKTTF